LHEHWPDEPELTRFFEDQIGLEVGRPFRGSVHFWPYNYAIGLTVKGLWSVWLPRTQIRAYRRCSPPRIGCAIMSPNRSIGRVQGHGCRESISANNMRQGCVPRLIHA